MRTEAENRRDEDKLIAKANRPTCEFIWCNNKKSKNSVLCNPHHKYVLSQISEARKISLTMHWGYIKRGCTDPDGRFWCTYGARGYTMTKRWTNFLTFILDMNVPDHPKQKLRIKDGETEFNKQNCFWGW